MDDEQTLASAMENLRRLDLNPETSGDVQSSNPKPKKKKAKLNVKLEQMKDRK